MGQNIPGELPAVVPNVDELRDRFFNTTTDLAPVKFGTSGHRGTLGVKFCQKHVLAVAQAVAEVRASAGYTGSILIGGDTRLMSVKTAELCAEVLAAHGVKVILSRLPLATPVFSYLIINDPTISDGIIGTASHNPPEHMGIKYNPSNGGPASPEVTDGVQRIANSWLDRTDEIPRLCLDEAKSKGLLVDDQDLFTPYLDALEQKIDFDAIKASGLKLKIHPLGGASLPVFQCLIKRGMDFITIVDDTLDPTFRFVPVDHDGEIRMDPSSPYPMKPLLELVSSDTFELAGGCDPDADRFGMATGKSGLINPNHALCIAADYLFKKNEGWSQTLTVGRTIGTTHLLDRITAKHGCPEIREQDVGFKHFVAGLVADEYALVGEESAGLSMRDWTTEKDGIAAVMLFAEITATSRKDLGDLYLEIAAAVDPHGAPAYKRTDRPADAETKASLKAFSAAGLMATIKGAGGKVADLEVTKIRDTDGIKIYMKDDTSDDIVAWALARPSGTEDIVKLYTESFLGEEHRAKVEVDAAKLFGLS